ncbi:MAG TPA: nuclear transport factor 2 family protein [Solirubrobacteraceae bacterium]
MSDPDTLGAEFARALAAKDSARLLDLMHPEIDFRAMTPSRTWKPEGPEEVLSVLFTRWFEDSDQIQGLVQLESDMVVDRERVGYRLSVTNPDGRFLVDQQAYVEPRDGRIGWMRVLCSGYRPSD